MVNEALINDFGAGVDDLSAMDQGRAMFNFSPYHHLQHHIAIPDAKERLEAGLRYTLGDKAQWMPAYDEVADWLTDNEGKGLYCVGTPGLGKTLICQHILPVLINRYARKVPNCYTAIEMTRQFDAIINEKKSLLFIDDIGTEPVEVNSFGVRRVPFNELCDYCERHGCLLVITTNLPAYMPRLKDDSPLGHKGDPDPRRCPSIEERYGLRTVDRLRAITKVIKFQGTSMRR